MGFLSCGVASLLAADIQWLLLRLSLERLSSVIGTGHASFSGSPFHIFVLRSRASIYSLKLKIKKTQDYTDALLASIYICCKETTDELNNKLRLPFGLATVVKQADGMSGFFNAPLKFL